MTAGTLVFSFDKALVVNDLQVQSFAQARQKGLSQTYWNKFSFEHAAATQLFVLNIRLASVVTACPRAPTHKSVLVAVAHPYWRLTTGADEDDTVVSLSLGRRGLERT